MTTFKDKAVWITGASSGIGEALAYAFAEEGAHLVLSARSEDKLTAVRAACAHPEHHRVVPLDLADAASLQDAVHRVLTQGPVDILVNNGGISQRDIAVETDMAVVRRIMEVNFFGTVTLTKGVLPSMLARETGHIVVVSSLAGKFGAPRRSAYSASKHALHGFFETLRNEVYDAGVRVTIVCPGYIRTNISINALKADGTKHARMDDNQEEGIAPEDCAHRILQAVKREKNEVYIGGKEVLGVYLHRFVPTLFNRILRSVRGA